jgi:hypothetical protein
MLFEDQEFISIDAKVLNTMASEYRLVIDDKG